MPIKPQETAGDSLNHTEICHTSIIMDFQDINPPPLPDN